MYLLIYLCLFIRNWMILFIFVIKQNLSLILSKSIHSSMVISIFSLLYFCFLLLCMQPCMGHVILGTCRRWKWGHTHTDILATSAKSLTLNFFLCIHSSQINHWNFIDDHFIKVPTLLVSIQFSCGCAQQILLCYVLGCLNRKRSP